MFKELQVFEDNIVNEKIDDIYQLLTNHFGKINKEFAVCGSVAKILDGLKDENYNPKDIDLLCRSSIIWRFLQANYKKIQSESSELEESRIKLFYKEGFLIEIWRENKPFTKEGLFQNKIYYCYGN